VEYGSWQEDIGKAFFQFSDLHMDGLDFSITLLHDSVRYECEGVLSNGEIEGMWRIRGSKQTGSWHAETLSDYWWPQLGAGVKPL